MSPVSTVLDAYFHKKAVRGSVGKGGRGDFNGIYLHPCRYRFKKEEEEKLKRKKNRTGSRPLEVVKKKWVGVFSSISKMINGKVGCSVGRGGSGGN